VEQEVEAELLFHLEERIEEMMARGMSRADAEAEVRRRFGDPERIGSEVANIDRATYRRRSALERVHDWAQGTRQVARGMVARPGYSAAVILTLALAIGANTAIYSAVNAVLLDPLPVPAMERIVAIQWDAPEMSARPTPMSAGEVNDLTSRTDLFAALAGFSQVSVTLTGAGEPRRVAAARSVGDVAGVFGLRPLLGTFYAPDASVPGQEMVVVLAHSLWVAAFGADPEVVGKTITLDDRSYQVVGVLPAGFRYPNDAQLWRPFPLTERALSPEQRRTLIMMVLARLRPEVSAAALPERLAPDVRRWDQQYGGYGGGLGRFSLVSFGDLLAGDLRPALLVLMGAVTFVLLIACANVASLQLVRNSGRAREIAVRIALGARRRSVVRQQLIESLGYAALGGLAGVALGWIALGLLARWDGAEYPILRDVRLDEPVLLFTLFVTVAAGLAFGVLPAWRAARVGAQEALKESGGRGTAGPGRHRLLQGAVVAQLALTLVLLVGSGVLVRSLAGLLSIEPGFQTDRVVTMQVNPPSSRYGRYADRVEVFDRLRERIRALPGVEVAGLSGTIPFSEMILDSSPFEFVGPTPAGSDSILHATAIAVSPEVFDAMGIRMLRGRTFRDGEGRRDPVTGALDAPVGIIDEQFAEQYFPGVDPVGRQITHYGFRNVTIVGVVESVNQQALGAPYKANIYYPYVQLPFPLGAGVVVRSDLDPAAVTSMVQAAVREIDPELPVYDARTLEARVERSLGSRSLATTVLGAFAGLALALALLGTYGVLSYGTSLRTQELGIRLAMGARPDDVVGMVLGSGARLAAAGLLVGVLVYLGVARALESMVYGIGPRDPVVLGSGLLLLLVAALLASWLPARRAAKLDPVAALRSQ
jgi:putative ABC transport system permease protein